MDSTSMSSAGAGPTWSSLEPITPSCIVCASMDVRKVSQIVGTSSISLTLDPKSQFMLSSDQIAALRFAYPTPGSPAFAMPNSQAEDVYLRQVSAALWDSLFYCAACKNVFNPLSLQSSPTYLASSLYVVTSRNRQAMQAAIKSLSMTQTSVTQRLATGYAQVLPWWQQTWFVILMQILPLFGLYFVWRKQDWTVPVKCGVTAAALVVQGVIGHLT